MSKPLGYFSTEMKMSVGQVSASVSQGQAGVRTMGKKVRRPLPFACWKYWKTSIFAVMSFQFLDIL